MVSDATARRFRVFYDTDRLATTIEIVILFAIEEMTLRSNGQSSSFIIPKLGDSQTPNPFAGDAEGKVAMEGNRLFHRVRTLAEQIVRAHLIDWLGALILAFILQRLNARRMLL